MMTNPIGYIEEFHNLPYYGDIYIKLVRFNDIYLILKTFIDTNTALDMCFNIGLSLGKNIGISLMKQGHYYKIFNQTQERFYNWVDIKMILLTTFDGKYSYFERLTTGSEDIQYDNMP